MEGALEKKISCGKCKGEAFGANILSDNQAVLISFTCKKCGHVSRVGVKRGGAQPAAKKKPEEKRSMLNKIRDAIPLGKPSQRFDSEKDLEDLIDES